jgi:methyl-accepting chemotaxis protein
MTVLSQKASLLSLNAAIEVLGVGEHKQTFSDITDKIYAFSNSSQKATSDVKRIIGEMASYLKAGKKGLEEGFNKIAESVNRLKQVMHQLENITHHDQLQLASYQSVNQMMQALAKNAQEISLSIHYFSDTVAYHTVQVEELYKNVGELKEQSARSSSK